jgi:alanine dehydrogenase
VAIVPRSVEALKKSDIAVIVEPSAGVAAGYTDDQYIAKGATTASIFIPCARARS